MGTQGSNNTLQILRQQAVVIANDWNSFGAGFAEILEDVVWNERTDDDRNVIALGGPTINAFTKTLTRSPGLLDEADFPFYY